MYMQDVQKSINALITFYWNLFFLLRELDFFFTKVATFAVSSDQ